VIVEIDINTGIATPLLNTGTQLGSIEFGPNHTLYGGGGQADGGNLYKIDIASGAVSPIGPTGMIGVTGLALVSDPGMDIQFNSADINGDLVVNLVDVGAFSGPYGSGTYQYALDFRWDGVLNLADVARLSVGLGTTCPAVIPAKPKVAALGDVGLYFDAEGTKQVLSLEPDQTITAYVLVKGAAASVGLSGFEYSFETSDNVVIDGWTLDEGALNVGKDGNFIVGLTEAKAAQAGAPLQIAQVRLHVTDREAAHIDLGASSIPSIDGGQPAILIGESLSALNVVALSNGASAAINDDTVDVRGTAVFAGINLHNSPNPFNPSTAIKFSLPRAGVAEVRIYDVSGREVRRLGNERLEVGANSYQWNGTDNRLAPVVSGVYFYRLFLDGDAMGSPVKMTLLK
jgi:hypothetical protein